MLARRLGEFAAGVDAAALPSTVVDAVKLRVLDTLGAGLAGMALGHHRVLDPVLESAGSIRVWGEAATRSAREAALVNCFATHSTYLEDGSRFTGGHPSSVVVPVVLADAQQRNAAGTEMMAAVLAGYEIFLRLGRAIYPACVQRGFQSTAVLGAVSSAAAIARLRRLSPAQCGDAIAIAANLGIGLKEALKSSATQPLQVARTCEGGMVAAALAEAGCQGAPLVLENGFLPAFGPGADAAAVTAGLGSELRIGETYLKRHAGCRGNHAPLDAALELISAEGLSAGDVRHLTVAVDSVTRAAAIEPPLNGDQAQFSIGFSVALAFVDGDAPIFSYTDARLADAAIRAMMARVEVRIDPALDARYPAERGAWVEAELASGRRVRRAVANARGEPEWPLSRQDVERKFLALAAPRLGERAHALREAIGRMEHTDGASIAALLAPAN
ncbi:MmgE/PrpD family protein [Variovorax sp. RA8]|uniref:MmgE/PrpD family protein n=1 Tax=Variovorax sp. (strain JCM 16519 / RA8) TaxID=662548 RepID=UPI001317D560|nr:MmgE/PrpD family protein [Variovorax sp. RA8]VTU22207.1 MmgE/PrpD family protein [Variovorax sp. RA8]